MVEIYWKSCCILETDTKSSVFSFIYFFYRSPHTGTLAVPAPSRCCVTAFIHHTKAMQCFWRKEGDFTTGYSVERSNEITPQYHQVTKGGERKKKGDKHSAAAEGGLSASEQTCRKEMQDVLFQWKPASHAQWHESRQLKCRMFHCFPQGSTLIHQHSVCSLFYLVWAALCSTAAVVCEVRHTEPKFGFRPHCVNHLPH